MPVALISGYIDDTLTEKAREAGVHRLIAKSGSPAAIVDQVLSLR